MMCSLKNETSFCTVLSVPLNTAAPCRCSGTAASGDPTNSTSHLKMAVFSECTSSSRPRRVSSNAPRNFTQSIILNKMCLFLFLIASADPYPVAFIKLSIYDIYSTTHAKMQSIFLVALNLFMPLHFFCKVL